MTTSIIVPFRGNDPHRQANLVRVLDHLADTELPIIVASDGREGAQPFNRSAAYNWGMSKAPAITDVFVFCEADMLTPLDQLADAIREAERNLGLVVPFSTYAYLPQEGSRLVLSGTALPEDIAPEWTMPNGTSMGAVNVASAETMRHVGRWDETLEGHGWDDNCMYEAFRVACGHVTFIDGPAYHLWHESAFAPWLRGDAASDPANFSRADVDASYANKERWHLYRQATTPAEIRALTGAPWPGEA